MSENKEQNNERNNNGTIGGAGGTDKDSKGSFHKLTENLKESEAPNVRGVRENEENHAVGSAGNIKPSGSYQGNEIDPNQPGHQNSKGKDINYPKKGLNHVDNLGGTSAEELDENN